MIHRYMCSLVQVFVLAMIILPGAWAEDTELSLGYLKVTEVGGGKLQVLVRCVEIQRVLEEIAKFTGTDIVFDTTCNLYVSQLSTQRVATPTQWIDFFTSQGITLFPKIKADENIHVIMVNSRTFDPSLQEDNVKTLFKTSLEPISPEKDGIATGLIFINGKMIEPPYAITHAASDDGKFIELKINNIIVRKSEIPEKEYGDESLQEPVLPSDGQFKDIEEMSKYIAHVLYPKLLKDNSPKEVLNQVKAFLSTQQIVRGIVKMPENIGNILVDLWDSNNPKSTDSHLFSIFPLNYDFLRGESILGKLTQDQVESSIVEAEKALKSDLNKGSVYFLENNGSLVSFSNDNVDRFIRILEKTKGLSLLQTECLLTEIISNRKIARHVAANLDDRVLSTLQTIHACKKVRVL